MATKDNLLGDERMTKSAGKDVRGSRESEDSARTQHDGGSTTAEERRRLLRQDWVQEVLPTVKAPEGWHYCWLSTTNSTDPIHKRIQLGYSPVKASEVPGFTTSQYAISGGDFDGCIACNEMLLFKIPQERYQDLMTIYHYDMPAEQEQAIRERIDGLQEQDSDGRKLVSVEGFDNFQRRPNPTIA